MFIRIYTLLAINQAKKIKQVSHQMQKVHLRYTLLSFIAHFQILMGF